MLFIIPGCCWGGCLQRCKPRNPCTPSCKPCKPCDDSCVIKEPRKSNRSYQKNFSDDDEDIDDDEEIIELENEF
jgi:hypothetical protein